ncbi:MAG TPA: carbon-nitrogen hydrolase family protein [Burkholderiaceae bacterium]|nr:carbon-nitrogen hydrolase family protein [Burkholderiaceae bacterium]
MRIAAVQMVSTPDVGRNLAAARRLVARAAADGAALVALPEYFCLLGHHERDKIALAEAPGDGTIQHALSAMARESGVWLVGGTLPMRIEGVSDRALNACCVYAPDGALAARYDKMHLFSFKTAGEDHDESRVLRAGDRPVAFDAAVAPGATLRVGLSICYDLRFPELYRALGAPAPCDLLCVPAAFTYPTGEAHWELLLRARAVENQCYVIAAAQGGRHENGRRTWGHSMIVDPWGEVLACLAEGEGVVGAELDLERIAGVRRRLPALAHRRADLAGAPDAAR